MLDSPSTQTRTGKAMARHVLTLLLLALLAAAPARAQSVSLATLTWEPYIGERLVEEGYVAAIVREAFTRGGFETQLTYLPWMRTVERTRQGAFQGYFPEYNNPALEQDFVCSDPIPGGPIALFSRKGAAIVYTGVEDLRPYRLGVVRGYVNTIEIDEAEWLAKEESASDLENLRKLQAGRVDVIVADAYVGQHLAREHSGAALAIALVTILEHKPLYLCVPRKRQDHASILETFNAGLATMSNDGTMRAIMDRHGFTMDEFALPGGEATPLAHPKQP